MQKHKKTNKLHLTAETLRVLGQDHLLRVIGGKLATKSYCESEADSCADCNTARCSNLCDTTSSL